MLRKVALVTAVMALVGCERTPEQLQRDNPAQIGIGSSNRFTVDRVGIFHDPLAYDSRRGIYLVVDTETGQEFVGISGIGISELGMHPSGKTSTADER